MFDSDIDWRFFKIILKSAISHIQKIEVANFCGKQKSYTFCNQIRRQNNPVNYVQNLAFISRKYLFDRIKSLQCYELTRRCNRLPHHRLTLYTLGLCIVNVHWFLTASDL